MRLNTCAKREERSAECNQKILLLVDFSIENPKSKIVSLDHPIRSRQHIRRDRQANLLGRFQIDRKLELCRLLNRQVCRLSPFENFVHEVRGAPHRIMTAGGIGNQATVFDKRSSPTHRWKPVLLRKAQELHSIGKVKAIVRDDKPVDPFFHHGSKGIVKLPWVLYIVGLNPHSERLGCGSRLSNFILVSLIPFVSKDGHARELRNGFLE
jgi:hypothetical protein